MGLRNILKKLARNLLKTAELKKPAELGKFLEIFVPHESLAKPKLAGFQNKDDYFQLLV